MNLNGRKVVNQIGKGSYSLVYDVLSPMGNNRQAIKLNFTESNITGPSYKEIIANLNLTHYYIMRIRDISEGDLISQCQYDATEYQGVRPDTLHFVYPLAKTDLDMWLLYNKASLSYDNALMLCSQISLGLEHIHNSGYIHRDLKPSNILVCSDGDGCLQCKIGDLGMTKYYIKNDHHITTVQTVYYRSPEIAMGYPNYDISSDVWSMGCIFYEIFKGEKLVTMKVDDNHILMKMLAGALPYNIPLSYIHQINSKFSMDVVDSTAKTSDAIFRTPIPSIVSSTSSTNIQQVFDVILQMLSFQHTRRPTISTVLDSEMFNSIRYTITHNRSVAEIPNPQIINHNRMGPQRAMMSSIIMSIFNSRYNYKWYSHRVLFQTIYNFDRLLMMSSPLITTNVNTTMYTLLYVSHKIVAERGRELSCNDFIAAIAPTFVSSVEKLEPVIFKDVFQYHVFYATIYDLQLDNGIMNDTDVLNMLKFVLDGKHLGLSSGDALAQWKR